MFSKDVYNALLPGSRTAVSSAWHGLEMEDDWTPVEDLSLDEFYALMHIDTQSRLQYLYETAITRFSGRSFFLTGYQPFDSILEAIETTE